jgi:hypothetical protein
MADGKHDLAGELMPKNRAGRHGAGMLFRPMQVGRADATAPDLDQDLTGTRLRHLPDIDEQWCIGAFKYRGAHAWFP